MSPATGVAWRFAGLAGIAAGLALAPLRPIAALSLPWLLALASVTALARPPRGGAVAWVAAVFAVAVLAGVSAGAARLAAIDAGRLTPAPGQQVHARGTVVSTPRVSGGTTRFDIDTEAGRIAVETRGPATGVDEGRVIAVRGTVRPPSPWEAPTLARQGAGGVIVAHALRPTGVVRGGLPGALDGVRRRAEAALERGTPEASAALLRGFVLGQDDRIPEAVRDEFRRSGLAHVLAVSGQNVLLLAVLAAPFLALAGVPLRLRLVALVALIAAYVPVAGAGPSIQRAGIMGAAGVVAALAGRPQLRWYAVLLAVAGTLAINPRATGDVGWQLSFAAVTGLLVATRPLAKLFTGRGPAGPARRLMADGAAMTLAATFATAPLAAHHFGTVSLTAIPANLLALPAIAPAMWLGMLAGALGQIPSAPVEPLTALGGLCAGFIAWVARGFGSESAQLEVAEPGAAAALAMTLAALLATRLACIALERRATLRPAVLARRRPIGFAIAIAASAALVGVLALGQDRDVAPRSPAALVIRVLDVGQGDAILLEPRNSAAVLVDTGPPGGGAAERLAELGIDRLGAVVITHDQRDHAGGLAEVMAEIEVERLVFAEGATPGHCRYAACPPGRGLTTGDSFRTGRLRIEALWPGAGPPGGHDDPNVRSLVLRARLGAFDALLTGDAEAEAAPVAPPAVDLLKVAHHGSADGGLPGLLERTSPQLAVISVGADNPYGHPAPDTLEALAEAGIPVRRTDDDGELVVEVRNDGWSVG